MTQTILPLPDIQIESCGVVFNTSEKIEETRDWTEKKMTMQFLDYNYDHMSEFLIDMCQYDEVKKFFIDLELKNMYNEVAEYCANELENDNISFGTAYPDGGFWFFSEKEVKEIIEKDDILKDGSKKLTSEENTAIHRDHLKRADTRLGEFIEEENIMERLVDLFRKSSSFAEFRESVVGRNGFREFVKKAISEFQNVERTAISGQVNEIIKSRGQ